MPAFPSDAWIDAMDAALAGHAGLREATAGLHVVVRTEVTGVPGRGTVAYLVDLDHGTNRVRRAQEASHADVSFTTDHETARGIRHGTMSAQAAFLAGRLRLGGDARVLTEHQGVLAEVDDVFASARADDAVDAVDAIGEAVDA